MEMTAITTRSLDMEPNMPKKFSSASLDMDWDKFAASVDVLEGCRASTMPAETSRPVLNTICTRNTSSRISYSLNVRSNGPDRLMVDIAEYRKGYHYSVETPQPVVDQENLTPRRVLDQQGSNDFTAYMQETAGSPILSPGACMVSSPFLAHTRQPFDDRASCRSRLSDYGYDTQSEDEEEDGVHGDYEDSEACCGEDEELQDQDAQGTKRPAEPQDDCGFWAEVGASEGHQSPSTSQYTSSNTHFQISPLEPVEWEVNEWDSASDRSKRHCAPQSIRKELFPDIPHQDIEGSPSLDAPEEGPSNSRPAPGPQTVLLPWDMD